MTSTDRAVRERSSDQPTDEHAVTGVESNGESRASTDEHPTDEVPVKTAPTDAVAAGADTADERHEPAPVRRPDPSLLPGQPPIVARSSPDVDTDVDETEAAGDGAAPESIAPDRDALAPPPAPATTPASALASTPLRAPDAGPVIPVPAPAAEPSAEAPPTEAPPTEAPPARSPSTKAPPTRTPPTRTRPAPEIAAPEIADTAQVPVLRRAPEPEPPQPVVRRTVVDAERHLIAPVTRPVGRRPRVRKVTRVLRHVDPWSVFKVAAVFSVVLYGVVLTAGVLLWNVAYSTGTIDNVEQFFESFGWTDFEFRGGEIYHSAWVGGLFVVVALTGFAVLSATLFNLITDLVGGLRMTVLEEEVVERTDSPMRRFTVRRSGPGSPVEEAAPGR